MRPTFHIIRRQRLPNLDQNPERITQQSPVCLWVRRELHLQLGAARLFHVRVHGLQEAQAAALEGFDVLVLLLVRFRVRLLESVDEGLEVRLHLRGLGFLLLDHLVALRLAQRHELLNLRLLLVVAEVDIRWRALRAQAFRERRQGREVPAALEVLEVARVSVLDGRVAAHTNLLAEGLAAGRAVNVCDQGHGAVLKCSGQLVPIGLHALAVASPRCLELHEHGLACHRFVPSLLRELVARGGPEQGGAHGEGQAQHGARSSGGKTALGCQR
mmetsp:Transcript_39365/g.124940  ORF Transcript_39365/g.124940 Transcript_39365/m.124940 type:complete len:272 (-) Transcript_39365:11-826(-)